MTATDQPRQNGIIMRCSRCHSTNVMRDAWASWDASAQEWVLGPLYDHTACDDCGAEECVEEVKIGSEPLPGMPPAEAMVAAMERAAQLQAVDAATVTPATVQRIRDLMAEGEPAATTTTPDPEEPARRQHGPCATEGCSAPAVLFFEAGGVGSWVCSDCCAALDLVPFEIDGQAVDDLCDECGERHSGACEE